MLTKKFSDLIIIIINKSRIDKRVIIIIISKYKNNVLFKYKFEWEAIIDIMNIQKDVN